MQKTVYKKNSKLENYVKLCYTKYIKRIGGSNSEKTKVYCKKAAGT